MHYLSSLRIESDIKSLKYEEAPKVYKPKQNKTPKVITRHERSMSSNYLKTYATFLDFVVFVITVKLFVCGILKFIYLKGSPASTV